MKALALAVFAFIAPGVSAAATNGTGSTVAGPHSLAPTKVAWYDASRPTALTPAAPMPGVGPKDVVVEGLTINTALLPISLPIPTIREVTAFTALQFDLPDGTSPGGLTLHLTGLSTASIDGKLPSGVTPIACPATTPFKSGAQQPTDAAPKYDCSKRSTTGQLSGGGKTVTFPGISRLADGNRLSVVILPGSLGVERLVFSQPTKSALSLLDFSAPDTLPTSDPIPTPTTSSPSDSGTTVDVPPAPPLPPAVDLPSPVASDPVIAPPSPATRAVALSKPDDAAQRTQAIGMLVALVVATAWLTLTERGRRTVVATGEWGVGRFRSERSGPPPTI